MGEVAAFFYIIASGWVKLFNETLDGKEAVIDILGTGNLIGTSAIFNNNIHTTTAQTVQDTEIIILPNHLLLEKIQENNSLALKMLSFMAQNQKKMEKEMEHYTLQNASQRIGCFLLQMYNEDVNKNIILNLPYDKTLIAARLGMKAETFSRALNTLREATNLNICGAKVEISDIKTLQEYCCGTCSSSYPCD